MNDTGLDVQNRVFVSAFGQAVESVGHGGIGHFAPGGVIQIGGLERATAIVDSGVDIDDFELLVQQLDGGQDAVTVQSARVQVIGFEVGGGHKAHAMLKQRVEQAVQDHGVGDVSHVEFVKADQLVAFGDVGTQHIERIDGALQGAQFAMHLAHELLQVQTRLAHDGHRRVEAVHQKAFAAPHPAVHVDTARDVGVVDDFFQAVGAFFFVGAPIIGATLQGGHSSQLGGVAAEPPCFEFLLVGIGD